jgi:hypothetical protein
MLKQISKLNKYEKEVLRTLEVEYDGFVYKGDNLLVHMITGISQGNYTLYNLATGGIGKNNPIGNLLAKLGVE